MEQIEGLNTTTRCYPRTLLEAFPKDYYSYIEEPPSTIGLWDIGVIAVSVCMWVGLVYWWSLQ